MSGLPGHDYLGPDQVDVELRPYGRADICLCREARPGSAVCHCPRWTNLEAKPVTDFCVRRITQIALRGLALDVAEHIDVDRRPHPEVPGEECSGALHYPSLVDEVEAFEQAVVRHLALELRKRPSTVLGRILELVCQRPEKCGGTFIPALVSHWAPSDRLCLRCLLEV